MSNLIPISNWYYTDNPLEGFKREIPNLEKSVRGSKFEGIKIKVQKPVKKVIIDGQDYTAYSFINRGKDTKPSMEIIPFVPVHHYIKYTVKKVTVTGMDKKMYKLNVPFNFNVPLSSKTPYVLLKKVSGRCGLEVVNSFSSFEDIYNYLLTQFKKENVKNGIWGNNEIETGYSVYDIRTEDVFYLNLKQEEVKTTKLNSDKTKLIIPMYECLFYGYVEVD